MKKNSNLKQEVKDLNEKLRNNKIYLEDDEEEEIQIFFYSHDIIQTKVINVSIDKFKQLV